MSNTSFARFTKFPNLQDLQKFTRLGDLQILQVLQDLQVFLAHHWVDFRAFFNWGKSHCSKRSGFWFWLIL